MITETSSALIELLFLRSVWSLGVAADLPPAEPPPAPGTSARPDAVDLEARWEAQWRAAVAHLRAPSAEDFWGLVHGLEGVDVAELRHWTNAFKRTMNDVSAEYHHAPEKLLASSMADAQNRGLRVIAVLPLAGHFARAEDGNLLVSFSTYVDGPALREALEALRT